MWLSSEEIIIAKTRKCNPNECSFPGSLQYDLQAMIDSFYVRNIKTDTEIKIDIQTSFLKNGIVTWYTR